MSRATEGEKDFPMEFCFKFSFVRAILAIYALGYPVFVAIATKKMAFFPEKPNFCAYKWNFETELRLGICFYTFHQELTETVFAGYFAAHS